jgi:hypothetical protein
MACAAEGIATAVAQISDGVKLRGLDPDSWEWTGDLADMARRIVELAETAGELARAAKGAR